MTWGISPSVKARRRTPRGRISNAFPPQTLGMDVAQVRQKFHRLGHGILADAGTGHPASKEEESGSRVARPPGGFKHASYLVGTRALGRSDCSVLGGSEEPRLR